MSCQSLEQREVVRVPEIEWPEFPVLILHHGIDDVVYITEEEAIQLAKFKVWYEANLNYYEQLEEKYNEHERPD